MKNITTAMLCLLFGISANAQWVTKHNMNPAEYQAFFTDCSSKGMRLINVSGYTKNGAEKYAAYFDKRGGPAWKAKHGMTQLQYQQAVTANGAQGYEVSYISGYQVGPIVKYAAIWEKKSTPYIARHGQTQAQFSAEFTANTNAGYRLIFATGYAVNNLQYFASVYEKSAGPGYYAFANMSAADYQQKFNMYKSQGYSVKYVTGCNVGGQDRFTAIWEKTPLPNGYAKHAINGNNYQNISDNFYYEGYKPVFISAYSSAGMERFNGVWQNNNMSSADMGKIDAAVNNYMTTQGVKALSIAVCKDERLVYAKGYGDANPATGQDMSPAYSLRIMSISKPVTSAGIMMLVKAGKLSLDKKLFGSGGVFGSKYAYPAGNKDNLEKITVRMLLHHTSGMRTCNGESEFHNAASTHADCMNVLLNSTSLFMAKPNDTFNYSNTNFFFLARVIEEVSGEGYETYIRNNVLTPSGIGNSMYVGAADAKPGAMEPGSYSPDPTINLQNFDGFGGWVARPIDLLKFMVRYDGLVQKPDLISAALHDTLTTATPVSKGYALGWIANANTQTHNGCYDGTRSFLYYDVPSGLSFAVIVNNNPANDACGWTMQGAMLAALKSVGTWPGYDLF